MRTGSTQLAKWLSLELGYKLYSEPHCDIVLVEGPTIGEKDIVVKEIYHHIENLDNLDEYIKSFDKVISLVRTDIRDCSIAIVHFLDLPWDKKHKAYNISDKWIVDNEINIQSLYSEIKDRNDKIVKLCKFGVTYSGVYTTKEDISRICNYLNLKDLKHSHLLGPMYKLRNNVKLV